jgi:ATP-binding cassette subfamily B protein
MSKIKPTSYFNIFKVIKDKKASLFVLLLIQIVAGMIPILIALVNGLVINEIAGDGKVSFSEHFSTSSHMLLLIGSTAFLITFSELSIIWHNFYSDYFRDLVYQRLYYKILEITSTYPTNELLENPDSYNKVVLAKENAAEISNYISVGSQVLMMIFSIIAAFILGFTIAWWIPTVLLITMGPFIYYKTKVESLTWNIKENYGEVFKYIHLYDKILTSPEFSKEVKIYKLQRYILTKWYQAYYKYFSEVNSVRIKGSVIICAWAILSMIGPMVCYAYVTFGAMKGELSLGSLSYLFGIVLQLKGNLTGLMYNSADVIRTLLASRPLASLLSMSYPQVIKPAYLNSKKPPLLVFEDVSFSYSNSPKPAVKNLNLELKEGEKLAIIGRNGSGKTTLIKLICRFYTPSKGKIYWKGQDIASIEFNELRSKIGTLFQDFSQFPFSVKENIVLDKWGELSDEEYKGLLKKVGLDILENKLDAVLSPTVQGGTDLSGGQWQRLALARLIANKSSKKLLLLDEPTSAIDPHAEYELLSLIKELIQDPTSIIISHRLSMCRMVDRIIVMEEGNIVEQGTHKELMKLKANYHDMLEKQLHWYQ